MAYEIEKEIPLPERKRHKSKYPFADMKVGDSFLAMDTAPPSLYSAACAWKKRNASPRIKFYVQKINNNDTRIWRTE